MAIHFEKEELQYSDPTKDGQVHLDAFLASSTQLLEMIDNLGRMFQPLRNDIEGNIKVLESVQKKTHFETVHSMLETEVKDKTTNKKQSGTVSMLWLKRALQFVYTLNSLLIADHKTGKPTENMGPLVRKSYEETLYRYHGWFTQQLFRMLSRAVPWRADFLSTLASGEKGQEDRVIAAMEPYNDKLGANLDCIQKSYNELNLDFPDKV